MNMDKEKLEDYLKEIYTCEDRTKKSVELHILQKSKYIPELLYKYYPPTKYSIYNFLNDQFFLQSPSNFNDPFDVNFAMDKDDLQPYVERLYDSVVNNLNGINLSPEKASVVKNNSAVKAMETIKKINGSFNKDLTGVTCFSENLKNELMWSHYADKHQGFCLAYDFNWKSLEESEKDLQRGIHKEVIYPVIYQKERPSLSQLINSDLMSSDPNRMESESFNWKIISYISTKSEAWKYEKEWRIIMPLRNGNKINAPKPVAVFLGVNIDESDREILTKIAKSKGIPVYQMKLSETEYAFDEPGLIG